MDKANWGKFGSNLAVWILDCIGADRDLVLINTRQVAGACCRKWQ